MAHIDITGRAVSRTEGTVTQYADKARQLIGQAVRSGRRNTVADCIHWFITQHDKWSRSTIRGYRASLRLCIEASHATGQLSPCTVERLNAILMTGPRPVDNGPKKTSAKKRKSMPEREFEALLDGLCNHGTPDALLLKRMLDANVILFLRPIELLDSEVIGDELAVKSAKATNGRGLGPERGRNLENISQERRAELEQLFDDLRRAERLSGSRAKLLSRLSSLLARICKKIGIDRVSLYTTRHIGLATAKLHLPPHEVAAAAGHRTTRTATSHYAKRRTGWKDRVVPILKATPETLARVAWSPKTTRDENLAHLVAVTRSP